MPYPHECPKGTKKCPTRTINDVENYLVHLLTSKDPLVHEEVITVNTDGSYVERHNYAHEPDPENEEDFARVDPAVWVPPQVSFVSGHPNFQSSDGTAECSVTELGDNVKIIINVK